LAAYDGRRALMLRRGVPYAEVSFSVGWHADYPELTSDVVRLTGRERGTVLREVTQQVRRARWQLERDRWTFDLRWFPLRWCSPDDPPAERRGGINQSVGAGFAVKRTALILVMGAVLAAIALAASVTSGGGDSWWLWLLVLLAPIPGIALWRYALRRYGGSLWF
jgi:hypothetical protein